MINKAALDLIKKFEGFRAQTYVDAAGVPTIGYGTTARAGIGIRPTPGMTCTEAQAAAWLQAAVDKFAATIRPRMTREPTPNQFGAMVSLAYNIGPAAFARSSVLRRFNAGDLDGAANAFALWNRSGGKVLNGLIRRRAAEAALFRAK